MLRAVTMAMACWTGLILDLPHAGAADPPNIVLIYGDDVGYGDLGCYGAQTIPTPNLDQLAAGGLRFTSAYSTSATCTPSRYSLLTGTYAWRRQGTGIAPPNAPALLQPGTPTMASMLQDAGYRTGIVGKWHLGLGKPPKPDWSGEIKPGPLEVGFDESFIIPTTNDRVPCVYVRGHRIEGLDPADPVNVFDANPDGQPTGITHRGELKMDWSHGHNESIVNGIGRIGFMTGGRAALSDDATMADVLVDEAREFIRRNRQRPFFLFFSAHQIHVPRVPHPRFVGRTPHGPRGDVAVEFDWCVGELIATLEKAGIRDNTLVIVSSDNGPVVDDGYRDEAVERLGAHRPAGEFRGGKYSRFEGGCRVPFIVNWPGRVASGVSDAMISQVDLFASLAAIVGEQSLPEHVAVDSRNLMTVLLGESDEGRDVVVTHSGGAGSLALRRGPWKYIEPAGGPAWNKPTNTETANLRGPQLYNLAEDPGETTNLARAQAGILAELRSSLEQVRSESGREAEGTSARSIDKVD